jgi:hypothetical protein
MLCEVARELELRDQRVGLPQLAREVEPLQPRLLVEDLRDLLRQGLVPFFLAVEEFRALGGVVDNLGDLGRFVVSRGRLFKSAGSGELRTLD